MCFEVSRYNVTASKPLLIYSMFLNSYGFFYILPSSASVYTSLFAGQCLFIYFPLNSVVVGPGGISLPREHCWHAAIEWNSYVEKHALNRFHFFEHRTDDICLQANDRKSLRESEGKIEKMYIYTSVPGDNRRVVCVDILLQDSL